MIYNNIPMSDKTPEYNEKLKHVANTYVHILNKIFEKIYLLSMNPLTYSERKNIVTGINEYADKTCHFICTKDSPFVETYLTKTIISDFIKVSQANGYYPKTNKLSMLSKACMPPKELYISTLMESYYENKQNVKPKKNKKKKVKPIDTYNRADRIAYALEQILSADWTL